MKSVKFNDHFSGTIFVIQSNMWDPTTVKLQLAKSRMKWDLYKSMEAIIGNNLKSQNQSWYLYQASIKSYDCDFKCVSL